MLNNVELDRPKGDKVVLNRRLAESLRVKPGDSLSAEPSATGSAAIGPLASGSATPTAASTLTEAQIASITDAANADEVEQGKLALAKATDPRVKQFARLMVAHHTEAKTKQAALLEKSHTLPEATPTSQALAKSGTDALAVLKGKSGAPFDRAYVDLQVKEHRDVLALLDDKILPAVHDAGLRQELGEARTRVADHLKAAESLQSALAGDPKKKP
jgi:putative membrane protein